MQTWLMKNIEKSDYCTVLNKVTMKEFVHNLIDLLCLKSKEEEGWFNDCYKFYL